MTDTSDNIPVTPRARKRWGRALFRLALLGAIAWGAWEAGAWWYAKTGRYVTTENAYVQAPLIAVSPPIDGRAVEVRIGDNHPVTEGELLFRIDPAPYQAQLRMAEARRLSVRNDLLATRAELGQIAAEMAEVQPRVKFFDKEVRRQQRLVNSLAGTEAKLDEMLMERDLAEQRLRALAEKREVVLAKLGGEPNRPIDEHPLVQAVDAEIELVKLDIAYTEVHAPVTGIATRVKLQAGEWVEAETPTFGIIGTGLVWVEANLKETQLEAISLGQPVEIRVDAYPDVVWPGRIESLSPATGAVFSALPPQNASGNWVKVVQRLPVRIAIEETADRPELRAGMSAVISVDTGRSRDLGDNLKALAGEWVAKTRKD